jgi:1-acyl-sn-glycerol-3-phosphate acyltransferase
MDQHATAPPAETGFRSLWYNIMHMAGMAGFSLGYSFRFEGTRHVPKTGPVLVLANHQSYFDPWIVGLAVKRHLTYLARKTLFKNPVFAAIIRSLNAVAIDQEGVGKEGIRTIVQELEARHAVVVFPEGSRTPDGVMHPLRPGVHLIIKRIPAAIVPVGIAGAYHAWPIWRPYPVAAPLFLPPGPGTIAVSIGKPIPSQRFADLPREQAAQELFDEIQKMQCRAEKLRRH